MWGAMGRLPADTEGWQMEVSIKHGQSKNTITEQYVEREEKDVLAYTKISVIKGIWGII